MRSERGFTLVEVIVSLGIFSVVALGMIPIFISHSNFNSESQIHTAAIKAATEVLDDLRQQNPQDFPTTGSDSPLDVTVGDKTFAVVVTYCADSTYCTSVDSRHLTVDVKYLGKTYFSVQTIYTKLR